MRSIIPSLGIFFFAALACGTETDPYTYADIELRDSKTEINAHLQKVLTTALEQANLSLKQKPSASDVDIDEALIEGYSKTEMATLYFSSFEGCILANNCPGWKSVDRIVLTSADSIYGESKYNYWTAQYIAPTLNLCGVRMGADKLSHMFNDAFRDFHLWTRKKIGETDWDVAMASLKEELSMMGKASSEVISFGDIHANITGFRLFQDVFYNELERTPGSLKLKNPIDICKYVSPLFDERVSYTEYAGDNAQALLAIIDKRTKLPNPLGTSPEALFKREGKFVLTTRDYFEFTWNLITHIPSCLKIASQFLFVKSGDLIHAPNLSPSVAKSPLTSAQVKQFCAIESLSESVCQCVEKGLPASPQLSEIKFDTDKNLERIQLSKTVCLKQGSL